MATHTFHTEEEQIIAMLRRLDIKCSYGTREDDHNITTIEVQGQDNIHTVTLPHVYVKWHFNQRGELVYLEFGY